MSNFSQMLGNRAEAQRIYEQRKKIKQLERKLQQKENIIKEVREYIENTKMFTNGDEKEFTLKETWYGKELLETLDKENK